MVSFTLREMSEHKVCVCVYVCVCLSSTACLHASISVPHLIEIQLVAMETQSNSGSSKYTVSVFDDSCEPNSAVGGMADEPQHLLPLMMPPIHQCTALIC